MYHPVIEFYTCAYGGSKEDALDFFKSCVRNHRQVMLISWSGLSIFLFKNSEEAEKWARVFGDVWHYGWNYDENTKKARELFLTFTKTRDLKLEDYL